MMMYDSPGNRINPRPLLRRPSYVNPLWCFGHSVVIKTQVFGEEKENGKPISIYMSRIPATNYSSVFHTNWPFKCIIDTTIILLLKRNTRRWAERTKPL